MTQRQGRISTPEKSVKTNLDLGVFLLSYMRLIQTLKISEFYPYSVRLGVKNKVFKVFKANA